MTMQVCLSKLRRLRVGSVVMRAIVCAALIQVAGVAQLAAQRTESQTARLTIGAAGKRAVAVMAVSDVWCSDVFLGQGIARLSWSETEKEAVREGAAPVFRAEVTIYPNGFANKRFSALEPERSLARAGESPAKAMIDAPQLDDPEGRFVVVRDLQPGVNYTWRLAVQTDDGWASSESLRFQGPICPVDSEMGDEPDVPTARKEVQ